jgi:hypothetical protein
MLNKISLALIDESGTVIPVNEKPYRVEENLDNSILELYSATFEHFKQMNDDEAKFAAKFELVNLLTNFLKENKTNDEPF